MIPTSLLAMVDASIGGKNGVDVPEGKNLIGTFYQPKKVLIDPTLLKTLSPKEVRNGLVEMIKHALIADKRYFHFFQTNVDPILGLDGKSLEKAIYDSCLIKKTIVEEDEKETGKRRLLNCGHTLAHALEHITHYEIAHGEAVAIGILVEAYLSNKLGYLSSNDLHAIIAIFQAYQIPLQPLPQVDPHIILKATELDKKSTKGNARYVLLKEIGAPLEFDGQYCTTIDESLLLQSFNCIPMLCVTIKGPSFEEAAEQILSLPHAVEMLEFRLDLFTQLDESFLEKLREIKPLPVIFTLREPSPGSNFQGTEEERLKEITRYARLNPEYFDLEESCPKEFIQSMMTHHPSIKIILSYHNYQETPLDLDALYEKLKEKKAHLYKIAVQTNSSIDALRLLKFLKNASKPICVMGMGKHGEVTRILGIVMGNEITYASVSDSLKAVVGQLSANTLLETYHFPSLNTNTLVYGLLGDPVDKSISHVTHNGYFFKENIPAVYVKIDTPLVDLAETITLTKELNFQGLSVTMPLKEKLLQFVKEMTPYTEQIGAANTLVYSETGITAYNTDGIGALNAIEKFTPVKGKKVMIIGAGGASKAIIAEALLREAHVTVINRTVDKCVALAQQFPIDYFSLEEIEKGIEKGYDILINSTPHPLPFPPELLLPNKIVMDIKTLPVETELLTKALEKGAR